MKKLLLLFSFFFSSLNGFAQDWTLLPNSPTTSSVTPHKDVWFININTGWISGSAGVWKTTNGGNNWQQQLTQTDMESVCFTDSLNGWATCKGGISQPSVYKTTNGGATWTGLTNIPSPGTDGLIGLSVYDANTVNAAGHELGTPRFIRTTNGGANWICKDLSAFAYAVVDCYFYSRDSGFVTGQTTFSASSSNRGVILWTGDGGATWSVRYTTARRVSAGWKLSFPDANTGYMSCNRITNGDSSIFIKTTNRGATWTEKAYTPQPNFFYDIKGIGFLTPSIGWVGRYDAQYVFQTTNGGSTWQQVVFGSSVSSFHFVTDSIGYAAGTRVYRFARTWLVPVRQNQSVLPGFRLFQNYPNPFNPITSISYTLPKAGFTRLEVYNVNGRLIKTLIEKEQSAGYYKVNFDASGLTSGVYFYKLNAGRFSEVQKMLLIK
jgi:photosystem II stability/assembly factor-like uncharacterized protein